MKKILFLDKTHPLLPAKLEQAGYVCDENITGNREEILEQIGKYEGVVIRSRIRMDKEMIDAARRLKFIARAGAGLENIDVEYAEQRGIRVIHAPEGNRNAVGEHTLGMLLALFNNICVAGNEIRNGLWQREKNRGVELDRKTVGIIGYGNMGKAFARKLRGFDVEVICYDIQENVGDDNALQVDLEEFQSKSDVVSLHVPINELSRGMVNRDFIEKFKKNFYLINTARGEVVILRDLVVALKSGKIKGAALDVLEYEKKSFESFFAGNNLPRDFYELIAMENVVLTPHIAGWTVESKEKIAAYLWKKILIRH